MLWISQTTVTAGGQLDSQHSWRLGFTYDRAFGNKEKLLLSKLDVNERIFYNL